jgi:hypothetical protein
MYFKFPIFLNIKEVLALNTKSQAAILAINRSKYSLPLKDITIIDTSKTKECQFKIGVCRANNPLEYTYLPEIVDNYPLDDHISPGLAMFAFPTGIKFKRSSDLPKWFSYVLTDEMGNRSYASCLVFTEEVQQLTYSQVNRLNSS